MSEETAVDLSDVPEEFHAVVKEYGKELFGLVMNCGVARQRVEVVGEVLKKHGSRGGLEALSVMVASFNAVAHEYALVKGWTKEQLNGCDRAIREVLGKKVVPVKSSIILQ